MDPKSVTRKLSAILSADVQGYSRLMGDDELATVETITEYRQTFTSLVTQWKGRVVDSPGDNILAEFASVVDAVQCAVEIQNVLKAKNDELPENRRMIFRIGVNLGDVIQEGSRIYGDGVNIAARIESLADGGGICVSGTAYDHIENKLALGYNFIGEHSVKNIVKLVRVYKVPMDSSERKEKKEQIKRWHWGALAILILILVGMAFWNFYLRSSLPSIEPASLEKMALPLPDKPSIAVLPFDNMSGDPTQQYFCDSITEEIIASLAKIPTLFVIARNSTSTYKDRPVKVQQVAEDLGVRYVLEGSVRKSKERIRVTAQLIDALSGKHLWAERYDRELKDLFDLQDDITKRIISALQVKLTIGDSARIAARDTHNLQAYLKLMEGMALNWQGNKDDNALAQQVFKDVIELDPGYATAYSCLGDTYCNAVVYGWTEHEMRHKLNERAVELANKAISLDPSDPHGHELLARMYSHEGRFDKAIIAAEKAVSLAPNSADINARFSTILGRVGDYEKAIVRIKKAIRLNPFPPSWYAWSIFFSYRGSVRNEEAIGLLEKVYQKHPNDPHVNIVYSGFLTNMEKNQEAIEKAEKAIRLSTDPPKWYFDRLASAYRWMGKDKEAEEVIERPAYERAK